VQILERQPRSSRTDDAVWRALTDADRACGEYPKSQQAKVWSWFCEGRFGK